MPGEDDFEFFFLENSPHSIASPPRLNLQSRLVCISNVQTQKFRLRKSTRDIERETERQEITTAYEGAQRSRYADHLRLQMHRAIDRYTDRCTCRYNNSTCMHEANPQSVFRQSTYRIYVDVQVSVSRHGELERRDYVEIPRTACNSIELSVRMKQAKRTRKKNQQAREEREEKRKDSRKDEKEDEEDLREEKTWFTPSKATASPLTSQRRRRKNWETARHSLYRHTPIKRERERKLKAGVSFFYLFSLRLAVRT